MIYKLKDVFDLQMGKTPSRNKLNYWGGDNKWISIADIGNASKYIERTKECITASAVAESGIKIVPKGTVIMSFKLSIGKTAITTEDMFTNEAIMAFIDKGVCPIDIDFFYHFCCGKDWLAGTNKAVMGLTLNKATLSEITITLPDIATQRKIATQLDKIDELIALRQTELELLSQLVKSRFIEMFGEPESNPHNYPIKKLSDIAVYWNGLTYRPEDVKDQGTIVLRSSNIQNSQLDFEDTVRVSCKIREKQYVQDKDILMCSRNGSAKLVGKVALITNITEPMSFGAFMMIIRSDYYRYLMTYFQMDAFRNQIKTGATTTINQITGNMLNQVTLPVPDLSVVNEFATFVEQIDKSKFYIQQINEIYLLIIKKSSWREKHDYN